MSEPSPSQVPSNKQHARHNFRTGVMAGILGAVGRDLVHPQLILAGLIYALSKSPVLVALVTIINKAFTMAPQLLASSTACAHVVYMDMIGRLIPAEKTGSYIGIRSFLGGAVTILVGFLVIQPILGEINLPWNYIILASMGALFVILDMGTWCFCREEPGPKAKEKTSFAGSLQRGLKWLRRDHNYRCYLIQRLGFRVSFIGLAFFIPYGSEEVVKGTATAGGIALMGGIMVAILKTSRTFGALLCGKLADFFDSRVALILGAALFILAPLTALLAPHLPSAFAFDIPGGTVDLPLLIYFTALAMMGLALQATMVGGRRFLIVNAPAHRRASYIGFLNTLTSPLTLLPLLGAYIASAWGMQTLFLFVATGGLISLIGAISMTES